jgi:hypothetical protein
VTAIATTRVIARAHATVAVSRAPAIKVRAMPATVNRVFGTAAIAIVRVTVKSSASR